MPAVLRTVTATRYVTPLREGGLAAGARRGRRRRPVRAQVPRRGAGRRRRWRPRSWPASWPARCGLPVPELVFVELDPELARAEPDPEIQDLIRASAGLNLGVDFLPGVAALHPGRRPPAPELAADVVWLDALVDNVDRTPRNPNLLLLARQPVADRPRRRALRAPRRRRPAGGAPGARSPRSATTCCSPAAGRSRRPTSGSRRVAGPAVARPRSCRASGADGAPYAEYLERRLEAPREWMRGGRACPRVRPFQYAIVRVVPRVERGECLNAGVVLFCRRRGFLGARDALDEAALAALAPDCDPDGGARPARDAGARGGRATRHGGPIAALDRPSASTGSSRRRARSCSLRRCTPA